MPQTPIFVAVGASAGGLEAFQQLVKGLPDEHDLIIVLIQHLDPDHESLMPELIAARTGSKVRSVANGMTAEPGTIYLMPPGYEMQIKGLTFELVEFAKPRGLRRPIDRFFHSLAHEHGDHVCAVVLSGTGSDGANGAREIKGQGGLVLVQDPAQAKYDGMPQSVLDLSGADVTARAEDIIEVVQDYFSLRGDVVGELSTDQEFLARILRHVRYRTGHDFSDYKEATMLRRVAVRMSVLDLASPQDYMRHIVESKGEAELLFRDLLINVTSFFRDPEHFDTLRQQVVPDLVETAEEAGDIRVWVAGCSTGEEAYSIAMLLAEEISRVGKLVNVVIFGTDIDEQALAIARAGRYSDTLVDAVPEPLRERYFRATSDGYEVGPRLREMVRFSRHSFIKDPPFSKLDMVSCRNVMIYLRDNLQELSLRVFHYALEERGYLFLGPSENPKTVADLFAESQSRARIFRRRPGGAKPLNLGLMSNHVGGRPSTSRAEQREADALSNVERTVLNEFAPAYFHVSPGGEVIYTSASASRFLAVRGGKLTTNLFSLVRPELESVFRRAARIDAKSGSTSELEFQGEIAGRTERLVIASRRMEDGSQLFVIRDQLQIVEGRPRIDAESDGRDSQYLRQLEEELDSAKQEIRTTVEELETSNEELKSSNEEMMSMNEELQSANEELTTINDELQEKLRELNQLNIDLNNFVSSARVPTVFMDDELRLKRFTPEARLFFSFSEADLGRPMTDLSSEIDQDRLLALCAQVIETQVELSEEFETRNGETHLVVQVMPYSPDGHQGRGAVVTLQDVTTLRAAVETAEQAKAEAQHQKDEVERVYRTSPLAMGLIDPDMRYVRLNQKLAEINGAPLEDHIGRTVREIIPDVADQTEALVRQVLETREPIHGQRVTGSNRSEPDVTHIWESDWLPFYRGDALRGVSVTVREITDEVTMADNLREIMRELEHRVKNMLANVNALVNRAARDATTDAEVFRVLGDRIQALAKTHALLTAESWSYADLHDLLAAETTLIYGADRVGLSGPPIRVTADAALAISMASHELSTNAAKYGAFSVEDGRVDLAWSRITDAEGDRLRIEWRESGGPRVEAPERSGFGSKLIKSTIEGNLPGKVDYSWEPGGLRVVVNVDFSSVSPA
ncbi:CheR family methyltransferase [Mesobacterium pallidum]|uniref:CheR family methyltransferase n=1 Tax=Mesobacterium pallidum TaxID=2872037 RepID=UPI001EE1E6EF|nr:CheR family methyltransferase [Mesobacterium pallidum]